MKKENRELAKKRKAAEKRKQAMNGILEPLLMYCLPSLLLVLFVAFCLWNPFEKKDKADSSNDTTTESIQSTTPSTWSADSSLTIEKGNTVNIDYVGSIDGVEFDGGNTNGEGTNLTIGSNSYIDDFEDQLIGHHPGDEVDVNVTFPDDYHNASLAGKDALFKVKINSIGLED